MRDIVKNRVWLFIAIVIGLVALATTNLTWGFLVGFVLQGLHLAYLKLRAKRAIPAAP